MRRHAPVTLLLAFGLVLAIAAPSAGAPIQPVRLIGGGSDQTLPSVNGHWVGWTANTPENRNHYDAYVRSLVGGVPSGGILRLNDGATFGWAPDLQTDANTAAFQRSSPNGQVSRILTVDLDTFPLTPVPPPGLDTPSWEWQPTISQSWILFGRETSTHSGVFLYNRSTHAEITLADPPYTKHGNTRVWPDDVTETYATWTRCGTTCNVYYYDIASHVTTHVPNPNGAFYYSSSVSDATGDLYFVRSGNQCGLGVRIFRWHIGDAGPYTTVASLPAGYDAGAKTSAFNDGTHDVVTFQRLRCAGRYYGDIYQAPAADTA
jgi:hypothetical protein